jgi:alkylation response protein AidB-like acyl-CoA dehydrogenase
MDFALSPEQQELRDAVRQLMRAVASDSLLVSLHDKPTGFLPNVWDHLRRAGWTGLAVPEEYGGAGASTADVAVAMEEYGRGPLPFLFIVATTLSPALIAELGTEDQKRALLPAIAEGRERVTVAVTEPSYGWAPEFINAKLLRSGSGYLLDGVKTFVADLAGATRVLVAARVEDSGRIAFVYLDPAASGVSQETIEGFVSWQSVLRLDRVAVDEADVLGSADDDAWPAAVRAMNQVIPLLCSYQVGSCQSVFEMSLAHTRNRVQFGQPIGRFQRVQDHLIELVNHLDAARWATYEAIWKLETAPESAEGSLHMTKSIVSEAHWEACNFGHEIHAGLGADLQYGLAKHTYLSRSLYHFLGEPRWHRELMVQSLNW